jgi:uncharacterized Zn finger protein
MTPLKRECRKCGSWKIELIGEGPAKLHYDYYKVYFCWACGACYSVSVRLPDEKKKVQAEKLASSASKVPKRDK